MPRQTSTFVPDVMGSVRTPLDEIPVDIKQYVETVFIKQSKTPGRERAIYDTEDELKTEWKLMVDYAAQRPQGVLKIRRSPTRDASLVKALGPNVNPDLVMEFRVSADLEANGARNAGNDRRQPAGSPPAK